MKYMISRSPWTDEEVTRVAFDTPDHVTSVVNNLAENFTAWSRDLTLRRSLLERFAVILGEARSRIVALLIREAGKNHLDAEAEADLLPKKIAISLAAGLARTPQLLTTNSEPQIVWRPRGVAVVLGPFNFPLHLLHGLVVPALAVGCTVIAKPSERCPALGALYGELLATAGLDVVCRVIRGGADVAQMLIAHPSISTVAAVGGRTTGLALARALNSRPEVTLALELGGVNPALVLDDANLPTAAAAIAEGAWRMAGQRCTATRHVHVPRHVHVLFADLLRQERQRWIPDGTPNGANGTLIDVTARERFHATYKTMPTGLNLLAGDPSLRFDESQCVDPLLLTIDDRSARDITLYREEQFGPVLIMDAYDDLDECLARVNANPYRLAAAVFTASRERFVALAARLPYGQVNHNRPTAGARSDQPFGGLGKAGNARPAALAAGAIFADESVVW
jgi:succinylglutamic semialdehyde dehydrogenase